MLPHSPTHPEEELACLAEAAPALDLLMLFGSRARGDAQPDSDWDLGYLAAPTFDPATFLAAVVERLGSDRVDLVDLSRASGLLRYRAARDGVAIFERRPRLAEQYRLDAADFWCDAGPIAAQGYEDVLAGLKR
jgi:predicted nucleotidyltransferase